MKIKVIDLLNKRANNEELPKKINYNDYNFEYTNAGYFSGEAGYLFDRYYPDTILNDEVEIIEEPKKIEKIEPLGIDYMTLDDIKFAFSNSEMVIVNKINEIIDYINKEE